jgi:hypothetical protein
LAALSASAKPLKKLRDGKSVVDSLSTANDTAGASTGGSGWLLIRFSGTEPVLRLYCSGVDFCLHQTSMGKDWSQNSGHNDGVRLPLNLPIKREFEKFYNCVAHRPGLKNPG